MADDSGRGKRKFGQKDGGEKGAILYLFKL